MSDSIWIIMRGGFSGKVKFWAGFKSNGDGHHGGAARSHWSPSALDAFQFMRWDDANHIIFSLRLFRNNARPIQRAKKLQSGAGPDVGQPQPKPPASGDSRKDGTLFIN